MTETISSSNSEAMYNLIKKICVDVGPGIPGSEQEQARAMLIKDEMDKVCDKVEIEEFSLAPNAYLGWFKLGIILIIVANIFFYLSLNYSPKLFSFFAFLVMIFLFSILYVEFILERPFIDIFYPKGKSQNVIGTIKSKITKESSQPPKKILIFSGHHDTAIEFRWLRHFKYGYYLSEVILIGSVFITLIGITIWFFSTLFGNPVEWVRQVLITLSYSLVPVATITGIFFLGSQKNGGTVPGAIDNLTAVAESIEIGKIIKAHPELISDDTEVRLISFGAEEAGVRGSRAYVTKHLAELKAADTMNLNFETLFNPSIWIFTSDGNGMVKHNQEFVKIVEKAAKISGVPYRVEPFPFGGGGTDSLSFSEQKIKSTCLFGMLIPKDMVQFYHQCFDDHDKVNKETLENALKIGVELLRQVK